MPRSEAVFLGLNRVGAALFVLLLVSCVPICWLPFLFDLFKAPEPPANEA